MGYEGQAISSDAGAANLSGADEKRYRSLEKLKRELGPEILGYLADPNVVEIMANNDGSLWVEHAGKSSQRFGTMPATRAENIVKTVASMLEAVVNEQSSILEGELPLDGSRFSAGIGPIALPQAVFTIRKKPSRIFTLDEFRDSGVIDQHQFDVIVEAVKGRKNICVVGGTGSGKTTLTNGIIHEISRINPDDRLVLVEDTLELKCAAENNIILRTSKHATMTQLIKFTLRMRPTRIIVGEVRDGAALDLLTAWNTGHPGGVTTFHCDDSFAGLARLEGMVSQASSAPMKSIQSMVGQAIDLIVFIQRTNLPPFRRITSMTEVIGFDGENYVTNTL